MAKQYVLLLGTLRSRTETSTKTSPQNITLQYRKSSEIIPSGSRRTKWPNQPENELVRAVSEYKQRTTHSHLHARVAVKNSNLLILLRYGENRKNKS